jgi:uncharacterized membrane protein YebE (DUF533 family)
MVDQSNDEYKGTGRFASAVGRATTDGTVGKIIGGGVGGVGVGLMGPTNIMEKGLVEAAKSSKLGAGLVVAGSLAGIGGVAHGAYKGWTNAAAAQKQFNDQKAEIAALKQEVTIQKAALGKFTENELKRETVQEDKSVSR